MSVRVDPGAGDVVEVFGQWCRADPVVVEVGGECVGVAVSELQGRSGFPVVAEPVDGVEFDGAAGGDEFVEHAATSDGLELVRVADEHESPVGEVGEPGQCVEVAGVEHAGFVDDQRGPGWEIPAWFRTTIGTGPFVDEFGDGVALHPGLFLQDASRFRGRGESEHVPFLHSKIRHCRARASWSCLPPLARRSALAGRGRRRWMRLRAASRPGPTVLTSRPVGGSSWASIAHDRMCSSCSRMSRLV